MIKNLLITGGAGFIGSNFVEYFVQKHPEIRVINLDLLTYAGSLENLKDIPNDANYVFIKGNIRDSALLKEIFEKYEIDSVLHFAAESHVDNSIVNPNAFVKTNVGGTFNLLHNAYLAWFDAPHCCKKTKESHRFYHISTDEVFGSLGESGKFNEDSPYAPNSPYAASKASSDFLVRSFHKTYGLNTLLTNCSNNYGPKQHGEKLIPTVIRKALNGENIPTYGDGLNVRDWLFVGDHVLAIEKVLFSDFFGAHFVIGGNCEKKNLDLIKEICALLDAEIPREDGLSYASQITFVEDRAGHDRRYAIDGSKIARELGFKPKESFESGIKKTLQWYLETHREEF